MATAIPSASIKSPIVMFSKSKPKFHLQSTNHILSTIPPNSYLVHATNGFGTWGAGVALAIHGLYPNADEVYTAHCDSFRPNDNEWPVRDGLVGGICVVPPQISDHGVTEIEGDVEGVWIGCLFTSYGFGRQTKKHAGLDKKTLIRSQTESALRAFREVVEKIESGEAGVVEEQGMRVVRVGVGKKRKRDVEDDGNEKHEEPVGEETSGDADSGKIEKIEKTGEAKEAAKSKKMDIYSPQFNSGKFGMPWEETKQIVEEVFKGWHGNWFVLTPPG